MVKQRHNDEPFQERNSTVAKQSLDQEVIRTLVHSFVGILASEYNKQDYSDLKITRGKKLCRQFKSLLNTHFKVANLNRSLEFYSNILGFKITKQIGDEAAFLAFGGYHHDICLNTWHSKNGSTPEKGTTGLFHLAILLNAVK
jgi:hypothetical protein